MPIKTVEFFWDPGSPYTYLASTQIDAIAHRCGASIDWKPFLLGKTFEATGNRPPVSVPAKGKHLFDDLKRWASLYGVGFSFPTRFPISSLLSERMACALEDDKCGVWAKAVMNAYWTKDADIASPDVLKAIAGEAGLDGDKLLAATQDQAVKDRLRANTEEAVRRGAFGAPTFFVGEQMFWGNDRLVLLEDCLTGKLAA